MKCIEIYVVKTHAYMRAFDNKLKCGMETNIRICTLNPRTGTHITHTHTQIHTLKLSSLHDVLSA